MDVDMDDAADYSSDVEEDATEPPTTAVVEQHASAVVAYDSIVGDVEQLEANFRALHLEAKRARDVLRAPSEYYLQPKWKREAFSGDQMLQGLFDCLARFDQSQFRRSREQVEMHLMWAQACLPQIYAHEYPSKVPELLKRFGVPSFWSFVAIFATRRFGKTFAMAMFVAAFLWTQERSVISVFSISQRTSKAMMDKILMMLHKLLPVGQELEIITKNQETLTIVNPMGIRSTVYSLDAKSLRSQPIEGWAKLGPTLRAFLKPVLDEHQRLAKQRQQRPGLLAIGANGDGDDDDDDDDDEGPSGTSLRDDVIAIIRAIFDFWRSGPKGEAWGDERLEALVEGDDTPELDHIVDVLKTLANPPANLGQVMDLEADPERTARMQTALENLTTLARLLELKFPDRYLQVVEGLQISEETSWESVEFPLRQFDAMRRAVQRGVVFEPWTTIFWKRALVMWAFAMAETAVTQTYVLMTVGFTKREGLYQADREPVSARLRMMVADLGGELAGIRPDVDVMEMEDIGVASEIREAREELRNLLGKLIQQLRGASIDVDEMIRILARLLREPSLAKGASLRDVALDRLFQGLWRGIDTQGWDQTNTVANTGILLDGLWFRRAASDLGKAKRRQAWKIALALVAIAAGKYAGDVGGRHLTYNPLSELLADVPYIPPRLIGSTKPEDLARIARIKARVRETGMRVVEVVARWTFNLREAALAAFVAFYLLNSGGGRFDPYIPVLWRAYYDLFVANPLKEELEWEFETQ